MSTFATDQAGRVEPGHVEGPLPQGARAVGGVWRYRWDDAIWTCKCMPVK